MGMGMGSQQQAASGGVAAPSAPTLATMTLLTDAGFTLGWTAGSGADSYTVQIATDSGYSAGVVEYTGIAATSKAITGRPENSTWYARVKSVNTYGESAWLNYGSPTAITTYYTDSQTYFTRVAADSPAQIIDKDKTNADIGLLKTQGIYAAMVSAGKGLFWTDNAGVKLDTTGTTSVSRIYNAVNLATPAGHDYAQTTKEQQPVWNSGILTLNDQAHQLLGESGTLPLTNALAVLTAFAVIKHIATPTATGYVWMATNNYGSPARVAFGRSTSKIMVGVSKEDGPLELNTTSADMTTGSRILLTHKVVTGSGTSTVNIRENGVEKLAIDGLDYVFPATNSAALKIGNLIPPSFARSPLCELHAILILPFAVTDGVRDAVEAYLMANYGG